MAGPGWPRAARAAEPAAEAPEYGLALCVAGPASPAELAALAELGLGLLRRLGALAAGMTWPLPPAGKP
jgi:hypothetical protein